MHLALYFVTKLSGMVLPMGNLAFALSVYCPLAFVVWKNQWYKRMSSNRWIVLYVVYLSLSLMYGFKVYRTPSMAIFDYLFFLYIAAILLIPPFSFNVKVFDRILAIGVIISCLSLIVMVGLKPIVLHDRGEFSSYLAPLRYLGAGAGYLLLKNAKQVNLHTGIGLLAVLELAVFYGVIGSYRGQLLLAALWICFFVFLQVRTIGTQFVLKIFSFLVLAAALVGVAVIATVKYQEQMYHLVDRFSNLIFRYEDTGDLSKADARIAEADYFMQMNSPWKLIPGHGVGALWYDFYGMFGEASGGTFAGARTMLHINWLHISFKIGLIGLGLIICMLVRHFRQMMSLIRGNYAWWGFVFYYMAWTTYYGHKDLNVESIVYLMILVNPWLFLRPEVSQNLNRARVVRCALQ